MTYIELINEFWKQNRLNPFGDREIAFYFYLLSQCNIREWVNPFELPTRIIELERLYSRKTIVEVRNKLKQKGLIDFKAKNNNATLYTIIGVGGTRASSNDQPNVSLTKHSLQQSREHLQPQSAEQSGNTIKDIRLKTKSILDDNNINSSSHASACTHSRTREEIQLEHFDGLLQEIYSGNHQIWEDQMRKKHGINSVREYLPSFRAHAIASSQIDSIVSVKDLTRYFNNAFRFFSSVSEIELLHQHQASAVNEDFRRYCQWVIDEAPNVAKGIYPLSEEEFLNLRYDFGAELIAKEILNLNNRMDLIKKYFSLYRTLINWCENEKTY